MSESPRQHTRRPRMRELQGLDDGLDDVALAVDQQRELTAASGLRQSPRLRVAATGSSRPLAVVQPTRMLANKQPFAACGRLTALYGKYLARERCGPRVAWHRTPTHARAAHRRLRVPRPGGAAPPWRADSDIRTPVGGHTRVSARVDSGLTVWNRANATANWCYRPLLAGRHAEMPARYLTLSIPRTVRLPVICQPMPHPGTWRPNSQSPCHGRSSGIRKSR